MILKADGDENVSAMTVPINGKGERKKKKAHFEKITAPTDIYVGLSLCQVV